MSKLEQVKAVYHVACMGDNWKKVVKSQLSRMQEAAWGFPIKITCNAESIVDISDLQHIIGEYKLNAEVVSHNKLTAYEHPALHQVKHLAQEAPDGVTIYVHSKGVSKYPKAERWRDTMDFFNIYCWLQNLKKLESGGDVIGSMFWDLRLGQNIPIPHYSGNYWTAKNSYINKLLPLDKFRKWGANRIKIAHEVPDRMCAEMYICSVKLANPKYQPVFLENYVSFGVRKKPEHQSFEQLKNKYHGIM